MSMSPSTTKTAAAEGQQATLGALESHSQTTIKTAEALQERTTVRRSALETGRKKELEVMAEASKSDQSIRGTDKRASLDAAI